MTHFECSISNQAELDIVLSNTVSMMTIEFGKILNDLNQYSSNSTAVCGAIFDATS